MISHLFRASNYVYSVAVLSYRALNLLQQIRLAKRGIGLASIAFAHARHSLGLSALRPKPQQKQIKERKTNYEKTKQSHRVLPER